MADEDTLTAFFCVQFFVDPDTSLPPNSRSFDVLTELAEKRFEQLGSTKIANEVKGIECYRLIDQKTVRCPLTDEEVDLPPLSGEDAWELTDSSLPSCCVQSKANSAVSFAVRTLFQLLRPIDPEAKWNAKKK